MPYQWAKGDHFALLSNVVHHLQQTAAATPLVSEASPKAAHGSSESLEAHPTPARCPAPVCSSELLHLGETACSHSSASSEFAQTLHHGEVFHRWQVSVDAPTPGSSATCLHVSPLVSAIRTASWRKSSFRFSLVVCLLGCSKCYQRSRIKPRQVLYWIASSDPMDRCNRHTFFDISRSIRSIKVLKWPAVESLARRRARRLALLSGNGTGTNPVADVTETLHRFGKKFRMTSCR